MVKVIYRLLQLVLYVWTIRQVWKFGFRRVQ